MAKIRHLAYRAEDPEGMAKFFIEGFGMTIAQRRGHGVIDLSDGTINITVLPAVNGDPSRRKGIEHIGFSTDDDAAAKERLFALGATERNQISLGNAHYEVKFDGPEGIIVDIGQWAGTAPIEESTAKAPAQPA